MEPAIRFDRVSKGYRVARAKPFLARAMFERLAARGTPREQVWALKNVSFDVTPGECVGVIGSNGSGKSTLLSLAARTSYPTTGLVEVRGRVGPLLELGAGFHPDLTGYENVFLNASLLGLSRREVEDRIEAIIDFAEIGDAVHAPLMTYSSGTQARLGFAVVAHIDAEVILIDETLAVGDQHFQHKCEAAIRRFVDRGATLLVVSHDIATVRKICGRVIWIESGEVREIGQADAVCEQYAVYDRTER